MDMNSTNMSHNMLTPIQSILKDPRKKTRGRFVMEDFYVDHYARLCGWKASLVYMTLCRHANKERYCFPGIQLMSRELAISPRSVQRGIQDLIQWGIIKVGKERRGNGRWQNNGYVLLDRAVWHTSRGIHSDVQKSVDKIIS